MLLKDTKKANREVVRGMEKDRCDCNLTDLDVRNREHLEPDEKRGDMLEIFRRKVYRIAERYADMVEVLLIQNGSISVDEPVNDQLQSINEGIRLLNHIASTMERIDRLQAESTNDQKGNKGIDNQH